MASLTYTRYEVVRAFRNRLAFVFSLVFPLVLFFFIAGHYRHSRIEGIPFPTYYMTGMMAWGTMAAVMAGGARIAVDRSAGWTRQMRITPLSPAAYFGAKILSGYAVAGVSIVLLSLAGTVLGVHLGAGQWAVMIGMVLVGLVPFAVLGILIGHLVTTDAMGPAMGGITSILALLGGAWGPLASGGGLLGLVRLLPSYWLVQAGKTALGGGGWPAEGWIVLAVWSVVLARVSVWVYRRDTGRVT